MFIYRILFIDTGNKEYFVFNYFISGKKKKKTKQIKKPQNIPVVHTCFLVRFDNVIVPKLCKM